MSRTNPKLVAETDAIKIDAIEDEAVDVATDTVTEPGDGGGSEPTGGPYKLTDDPLVKPMGGPYKPTTDEPAVATQTR